MFYIVVTIFPVIVIASGVVALVGVVRFVATLYRDIRAREKAGRSDDIPR
jgi:hypothetical protein